MTDAIKDKMIWLLVGLSSAILALARERAKVLSGASTLPRERHAFVPGGAAESLAQ